MVGIFVGNPASMILGWAIVTMVVGFVVGLAIGTIAQRTVDDHIAQYKAQHPIPGEGVSTGPGGEHAVRNAA